MSCCCVLTKEPTWPSACGAPAYAADPQPRWRAGLAAAYLARSAACAGRHRSGEVQNKNQQQVKPRFFAEIRKLDLKSNIDLTVLCQLAHKSHLIYVSVAVSL